MQSFVRSCDCFAVLRCAEALNLLRAGGGGGGRLKGSVPAAHEKARKPLAKLPASMPCLRELSGDVCRTALVQVLLGWLCWFQQPVLVLLGLRHSLPAAGHQWQVAGLGERVASLQDVECRSVLADHEEAPVLRCLLVL